MFVRMLGETAQAAEFPAHPVRIDSIHEVENQKLPVVGAAT